MSVGDLLNPGPSGLECPAGGFVVDPATPAARAVITHAHADHARPGCGEYWCAAPGAALLRHRLGPGAIVHAVPYGRRFTLGGAEVSFHPAGHVLGSAQVRIERGAVWVVSGDYKRDADPTCAPFETVRCDVFVSEATFALPVYRWPAPEQALDEIAAWWEEGAAEGRASLLLAYALGKAQRVLAGLAARGTRPVWVHGAIDSMTRVYRETGVALPETRRVSDTARGSSFAGELVIAPPGADGTPWMRRFASAETAFASGWMRIRGMRRRQGMDRGFVLSDHADWPALLRTVEDCGAKRVLATHGHAEILARALRERGVDAAALPVLYGGGEDDA